MTNRRHSSKVIAAVIVAVVATAYAGFYLARTNLVVLPVGTPVYLSCSWGSPMGLEPEYIEKDMPCRVIGHLDFFFFRPIYSVERMLRGGNLLLQFEVEESEQADANVPVKAVPSASSTVQ